METNNTLHLVLKRKWYEMIASGEKTEEYRELKPYWQRRLFAGVVFGHLVFEDFDFVCFHLGYTKETMVFVEEGLSIGRGKPEWGAPTDKDVFILKLGKRIK